MAGFIGKCWISSLLKAPAKGCLHPAPGIRFCVLAEIRSVNISYDFSEKNAGTYKYRQGFFLRNHYIFQKVHFQCLLLYLECPLFLSEYPLLGLECPLFLHSKIFISCTAVFNYIGDIIHRYARITVPVTIIAATFIKANHFLFSFPFINATIDILNRTRNIIFQSLIAYPDASRISSAFG